MAIMADDRDGAEYFKPPEIPTQICCMQCGEIYESYLIQWRDGEGPPGLSGAWCCPTPGCSGVGFLFDIWPTDPEWRDEYGDRVCFFDDDDDDEFDDEEEDFDDELLGDEDWEDADDGQPWDKPFNGEDGPDKNGDSPDDPPANLNEDDIPF